MYIVYNSYSIQLLYFIFGVFPVEYETSDMKCMLVLLFLQEAFNYAVKKMIDLPLKSIPNWARATVYCNLVSSSPNATYRKFTKVLQKQMLFIFLSPHMVLIRSKLLSNRDSNLRQINIGLHIGLWRWDIVHCNKTTYLNGKMFFPFFSYFVSWWKPP